MARRLEKRDQRRVAIAIGISIGLHALAFATIKLDVPIIDTANPSRVLQVVEIPDNWAKSAMEVVVLESAASTESGAANEASSTSAAVDLSRPGAAGREATVAAIIPLSGLPGAAVGPPAVSMTFAEAIPLARITLASTARRGVIERTSRAGAAGSTGYDFIAASDAAREAERKRGGGGRGGLGGPGVTLFGGGGDGHCPTWGGIPLIPQIGGRIGAPLSGRGQGISGFLGARPPGAELINRFGPRVGIGSGF